MSNIAKLMFNAAGGIVAGGEAAEGVSFDGTNDYLSRTSDLTGNADGKTFTFSCWVYFVTTGTTQRIYTVQSGAGGENGFQAYITNTGQFIINNYVDGGGGGANRTLTFTSSLLVPEKTWSHIVFSCDLTNTSNRHLYINDVLDSSVTYGYYNNLNIDFALAEHYIGYVNGFSQNVKGRLAHVYLDYTYRDLSVEANRRLFITDDFKPASGLASLSPILYLPLTDADTAGDNSGTGGDFTVNGTLDTAQRGPNQNNCVASEFDGSNDYLTNSSISITNSKVLSGAITYRVDGNDKYIFMGRRSGGGQSINFTTESNFVRLYLTSDSAVQIAKFTLQNSARVGQHHHLAFCIDTDNQSGSKVFLDGVDTEITFDTFVSGGTFNIVDASVGAQYVGNNKWDGMLGELYLDDAYIDLASDNIFWDEDANRPKPVRQVLDETDNTPLVAMPIEGNDAGLNLGTGGNFNVNSGPYIGARGGSEYWARSAAFSASLTSQIYTTSPPSDTNTLSMVIPLKNTASADGFIVGTDVSNSGRTYFKFQNGSGLYFYGYDSSNNRVFANSYANTSSDWQVIFLSVNTATQTGYIGNGSTSGTTFFDSTNQITLGTRLTLGSQYNDVTDWTGFLSNFYLTDSYIDFSQESNRNLFVDQFGYPKDLTAAIDSGDIPTPLIYLKFDDPDDLGANSGTGGDLTVNGTVTQGSDYTP